MRIMTQVLKMREVTSLMLTLMGLIILLKQLFQVLTNSFVRNVVNHLIDGITVHKQKTCAQ